MELWFVVETGFYLQTMQTEDASENEGKPTFAQCKYELFNSHTLWVAFLTGGISKFTTDHLPGLRNIPPL